MNRIYSTYIILKKKKYLDDFKIAYTINFLQKFTENYFCVERCLSSNL